MNLDPVELVGREILGIFIFIFLKITNAAKNEIEEYLRWGIGKAGRRWGWEIEEAVADSGSFDRIRSKVSDEVIGSLSSL